MTMPRQPPPPALPLLLLYLLLLLLPSLSHAFLHHPPPSSSSLFLATATTTTTATITSTSIKHGWPPASPTTQQRTATSITTMMAATGKNGGGNPFTKAFTALPRFVGRKLLDGTDRLYLKKCLFLPPSPLPGAETNTPPTDMVIIFYPGIGLGPTAYRETALAIQETLLENYDVNAYIVIAKFFKNFGYLPQEPERRMTSILGELAKRGVSPRAPVGVVGHSGGAFLAYEAALTRSQAFVHLGSTLNSRGALPWTPRSVVEFPKPILQLLGEMDGYIRFTGGALEYAEVEGLMAKKGFEEVMLEKPVVVLPGVSHQQFADGTQAKVARMSGRRDLPPYVSLQEAQRMTGKIVASFLAYHLCGPEKPKGKQLGENVLRQAFDATGRMVRPYLNELEPQAEDDFIRWAQAEVASVEGVGRNSVRALLYHTEAEFIYSKPSLDTNSEYLQVCVRKSLPPKDNTIQIGFTKQISPALGLKMKRQEAVVQALRRYPSKKAPTAAELNRRTFDKALEKVSEEARRRYERYGRKLEFLADDEITAERGGGPAWVAAPLQVQPRGEDPMRVTVRAPVLYTPIDALPRFAGMCYMKLLTPAQAVEWILHDAYIPWDPKAK